MGDRALVLIQDKSTVAVATVYLHWDGWHAIELLKGAIPRMRWGNPSYSTARFIGHCHSKIDGNLSLGVFAAPENTLPETLEEFSQGDAGVLLYHCDTGRLEFYGGYLADEYPDGLNLAVPPG